MFNYVSMIGIKVHEVNDTLIDVGIYFVITISTSINSNLLWNSLKSNRICDLSYVPGVVQNVSPFSRALIWFSSKIVFERLMALDSLRYTFRKLRVLQNL